MNKEQIIEEINSLKKVKNASILAHFYQDGDIQDIADLVADSLGLAQAGKNSTANILLIAGVHFMGETAKILSPEKTVLVPDLKAGCSLADNCPADKFSDFISKYPDHEVVTYVNCSAAVKALSTVLCTSSNAVKIINSITKDKPIIFAPDKHLGNYLKRITGREMIIWDGACMVHEAFEARTIIDLKRKHPEAIVLAHPECPEVVLDLADHIGSTSSLLNYSIKSDAESYIVVTESGIIHQMEKSSPNKKFIPVSNDKNCNCAECPYMRLNTLEKIRDALRFEEPKIEIPEEIRVKAVKPLERMLEISAS